MARPDPLHGDAYPDDTEQEVRERVKQLKGFYSISAVFMVLSALLIVINVLTTPGTFWAIWPLLGLGTTLLFIAILGGFLPFGIGSKAWEDRKVRELMLQRQRGLSAEQVRALLREELHVEQHALPDPAEWDRMRQRIENLEAIVTSPEWDEVAGASDPGFIPNPGLIPEEESEDLAKRATQRARRVR